MSGPRVIPDEARARQARASDPTASVFVSANAGSGKTYVLVNRVIRLLLDGVSPEKILCVTFTKAAAANMAERVFTKLGQWVTLDDAELDNEIRSAGIAAPGSTMRGRARELFACALETPGGLKVRTIHALCTQLLQQFPFEANVPARFSVLDDRDQNEMMERASLKVLLQAAAAPDSAEGRALTIAMTSAADVTFRDVVREASLSRDQFLAWVARAGSTEIAMAQLSQALGVSVDDSTEAVETEIVDGPNLPRERWIPAAEVLETGGVNDGKQGARLREALQLGGSAQVDEYLRVFFTDKMEPRKALATKAIEKANPSLCAALGREADRIMPLLARRRAVAMRDRTQSLFVIATGVAANYGREKNERGLLDYDDLIDHTLAMLERVSSSWVHYKLDRGVDHVLIDEAQDTSPRQWDIINHLISEFTSGEGAREGLKRTIFAVGDEKQSIFSFQGAAPREFDERRRALQQRFSGAGLTFDPVAFTYSFRTGAAILQSVDHVFRDEAIYRSIHNEGSYPIHQSLTDAGPSLIDLWELQRPDDREEIEGWQAPFDALPETSPEVRLAQRVQAEIRTLIADGTQTGPVGRRRALRYGDVLILVRRRGRAFDAIIQALKQGGIPVAGADRLKLTEHIAIIDLMHLADALLLPQDDLALAVALKSPLFGLDDDDLFKLAWKRKGTLRAALDDHAAGDARIADALRRLQACEDCVGAETPFGFYAWLLGGSGHDLGEGGRARILRRLGHEANDALDEFLELALGYERKAPASLQGLVAWLRAADTEVKRDMEISRDEVRVMTVHGAKGLEAPVVFLVDTTSSPADTQRLNLIHLPVGNAAPHGAGVVVWAGRKGDDPPAVADARAGMIRETEDEYRRLLYVAMTRAADRLIVGGCMPGNRNEVRPLSWYDLIVKGLEGSGLQMQQVPPPDGVVKRYSRVDDVQPEPGAAAPAPAAGPVALPPWLRTSPPALARRDTVVRPSDPGDDRSRDLKPGESDADRKRALQRGSLVHRLLQSLPDVAPAQRHAAALRYLARNADSWSDDARAALATQVIGLLDDGRFKALFAPGSRAEVAIVGRLAQRDEPLVVSGQIDRLVVSPAEVWIVDYKTNHAPPRSLSAAPQAYVRQLALYRAVLAKLYPDRPVRAALLWTEAPEIMEISPDALDAMLASIISP
jgi:ATP-dependent helicase/nuclease subunit A